MFFKGGAVAEWSKALRLREKINENNKIPCLPPDLGNLKNVLQTNKENLELTWHYGSSRTYLQAVPSSNPSFTNRSNSF